MDASKIRVNELVGPASGPAAPAREKPPAQARLQADSYRPTGDRKGAFAKLSARQKGWMGLKLGASMVPGMAKELVANPGELLKGLVAPYRHPLKSFQEAQAAVKEARKQGFGEAAFTALKAHGGLVSAWAMPVALALAPITGGASLVAGLAALAGTVGLAATGASLVKNTVDAARADSEAELKAQATEIAADGVGLAAAAVTRGAAKGVQKGVKQVRTARDPLVRAQKAWAAEGRNGFTDAAPEGNTRVGKAVNQAVRNADDRTVPVDKVFTRGSVEEVWVNDLSGTNKAMAKLAREIRENTSNEAILQSFAVHGDSEAVEKVFRALAERQKANPDYRVILMHTGEYERLPFYSTKVQAALERHGVKAYVASYMSRPSTQVNHSKSYLLDRHTAVFGGNNIQTFAEQDVLIKTKGAVVDAFLEDARHAWTASKKKYYFDGKTAQPITDLPALFEDMPVDPLKARPTRPVVPMTVLSKSTGRAAVNSDANAGLVMAVRNSRSTVKIKSPNFSEAEVVKAVEEAARNGSKVQLLLSRDHNSVKSILSGGNNRQVARRLAQLPEQVRENIEVRWWSDDGKTVRKAHTKFVGVDDEWTYIGPQNMDKQSFRASREIGVGIDDAATAAELTRDLFDGDWAKGVPADARGLRGQLADHVRARIQQRLTGSPGEPPTS